MEPFSPKTFQISLRIPFSARYLVALFLLRYLMGQAHEFAHLSIGRLACDTWVGMTFNLILWPEGCSQTSPLALLSCAAGPLLSYALMWQGMLLLRSSRHALLGYTLIFANLPLARFITAAMNGGDEMGLGRHFLGADNAYWTVLALVTLLIAVPLLHAYRAPSNPKRVWVFMAMLFLPLLFDWVFRLMLLESLLSKHPHFLHPLLGVPTLVWVVNILVLAAFIAMRPQRIFYETAAAIAASPAV